MLYSAVMNKVQLTLTDQEIALLEGFGSQFGYNLSKTIRYVISKASEKILQQGFVPTYQMSEKTEAKGLEAVRQHRAGQTTKISSVGAFFDSL